MPSVTLDSLNLLDSLNAISEENKSSQDISNKVVFNGNSVYSFTVSGNELVIKEEESLGHYYLKDFQIENAKPKFENDNLKIDEWVIPSLGSKPHSLKIVLDGNSKYQQ